MSYQCPKCESTDLEVAVTVWASLLQNEDGFETDTSEPDDSSHEWDGNSTMVCKPCGHIAPACQFDKDSDDYGVDHSDPERKAKATV